jgi:hypothetical protein
VHFLLLVQPLLLVRFPLLVHPLLLLLLLLLQADLLVLLLLKHLLHHLQLLQPSLLHLKHPLLLLLLLLASLVEEAGSALLSRTVQP